MIIINSIHNAEYLKCHDSLICFPLCLAVRKGFLLATLPMRLWLWRRHLMVLFETWWPQDATKACSSFTVILGDFVASLTLLLSILGGKMQSRPLPMRFSPVQYLLICFIITLTVLSGILNHLQMFL